MTSSGSVRAAANRSGYLLEYDTDTSRSGLCSTIKVTVSAGVQARRHTCWTHNVDLYVCPAVAELVMDRVDVLKVICC